MKKSGMEHQCQKRDSRRFISKFHGSYNIAFPGPQKDNDGFAELHTTSDLGKGISESPGELKKCPSRGLPWIS